MKNLKTNSLESYLKAHKPSPKDGPIDEYGQILNRIERIETKNSFLANFKIPISVFSSIVCCLLFIGWFRLDHTSSSLVVGNYLDSTFENYLNNSTTLDNDEEIYDDWEKLADFASQY